MSLIINLLFILLGFYAAKIDEDDSYSVIYPIAKMACVVVLIVVLIVFKFWIG